MFGHRHYVPVLRAKPAELRALKSLDPAIRSRITPLLECPPRVLRRCGTREALERRFDHMVGHIHRWAGRPVFFDFAMLGQAVPHALEVLVARAIHAEIQPIVVVSPKMGGGTSYARSVQSVLQRDGSGLCVRVSPEELKLSRIDEMLRTILRRYDAAPEFVDLVVDRGEVGSGSVPFEEFAQRIPWVEQWRTLTVLAGSFPEDLSRLAPSKTHRLQRFEWQHWHGPNSWSGRKPAFGDYTIQPVLFREPVAVPNFSASSRYTMPNEYFVLRGEGVLNEGGPGYGQWNAWASLLVEMPEYFGSTFCAGDEYIRERAEDWKRTGSAQTWLQAGFNHHLTTTALQVAGRLEQVRRITATATTPDWASVVGVDQPEVPISDRLT